MFKRNDFRKANFILMQYPIFRYFLLKLFKKTNCLGIESFKNYSRN